MRCITALWLLTVAVACGGDEPVGDDPVLSRVELRLTPEHLIFDSDNPDSNVFHVETDAAWRAETSDSQLKFEPASGMGDGTIVITDMPEEHTFTLVVKAGQDPNAVERSVTVTRPGTEPGPDPGPGPDPDPDPGQTVFSLDFGASMGSDSKFADSFDDWKTQTGMGAAGVDYDTYGVKIRSGYDGASAGASGQGYATITATRMTNHLNIRGIALPAGVTDFTLSFYTTCATGDLRLLVSGDKAGAELTHTAAPNYNTWVHVEVGFTLKTPAETIDLSFAPSRDFAYDDRRYGLNLDDVVLVTGGGGQQIDIGGTPDPPGPPASYRLPELPGNWVAPTGGEAVISGDLAFYTHWTTTVTSGKRVRNFSYCYDTRRRNPIWVAYPLAACYTEGGFGRTTPDPWAPDPSLDVSYQSKIYRSDGASGTDPYQYWSKNVIDNLGRGGTWSKGHLCMSSERGGKDKEINRQTFYPTNIAPQPTAKACDFGRVWGDVEALISGTRDTDDDIAANDNSTNLNRLVDTLYVVAGCYYEHDYWKEYDSSDFTQPVEDPGQKECTMPTHQWKMALRVKNPSTHKPIAECSADELQAVGFWMDTFIDSDLVSRKEQLRAIAVPVSFIEQKMGVEFFPGIPASVKAAYEPEAWGF